MTRRRVTLTGQDQTASGEVEGQLEVGLSNDKVSLDIEIVCVRIAQEALTNAIRHAWPKNLHVRVWTEHDRLHLLIRDDGIGFDVNESSTKALEGQSVELISMQERAFFVGGECLI